MLLILISRIIVRRNAPTVLPKRCVLPVDDTMAKCKPSSHEKKRKGTRKRANSNSKHVFFGKIVHACTAEETCGSQTTLFSQQSLQSSLEGLDELSSMALESMDETLDFNETLMDVDDSTSMVSTYKNGGRTG